MALIGDGTVCPLCSRRIDEGEDVSSTSGTWDEAGDLAAFCDAAMHRRCFEAWPDAERFCRSQFKARLAWSQKHAGPGGVALVHATLDLLVTVDLDAGEVGILSAWPRQRWSLPLDRWDAQRLPPASSHSAADEALATSWPGLRRVLPSAVELRSRAMPHRLVAERLVQRQAAHDAARAEAFLSQAQAFQEQLTSDGATCVHCGVHGTAHTLSFDREGQRTSFWVCASCHRSTTLDAPMPKFDHRAVLAELERDVTAPPGKR